MAGSLNTLAPHAILVDRNCQILLISGDVNAYLCHPAGIATDDLWLKIREEIRPQLRKAVQQVLSDGRSIDFICKLAEAECSESIRVTVIPIQNQERSVEYLLILFAAVSSAEAGSEEGHTNTNISAQLAALPAPDREAPIAPTGVDDSSTLLAQEGEELKAKHAELENLISATQVAAICLDTELAIRWYTATAQQLIRIESTDVGRPLADLKHDLVDRHLIEDCHRVLENLIACESETACSEGRAFIRRIVPYRSAGHLIGGVVITFLDITTRKIREQEIQVSEERFRCALSVEGIAVLFFSAEGTLVDCNDWFLKLTGFTRDDIASGSLSPFSLTPNEWSEQTAIQLRELKRSGHLGPYEKEYYRKDGTRIWMMFSGCALKNGTIVVHGIDLSDRKRIEAELRELNRTLEHQVEQRTEMLQMLQNITGVANEARTVDEAMSAALSRIAKCNGWTLGHLWKLKDGDFDCMESSNIWYCSDEIDEADAFDAFREETEKLQINRGQGWIGTVLAESQTGRVREIGDNTAVLHRDNRQMKFKTAVAIPITIDQEVVAIMEFFSREQVDPDERFLETMPAIGIHLGHVVRRRRLEQLVATVANEEQCRIGRELHDGIAQQLTGGALIAESILRNLPSDPSELRTMIRQLADIFGQTHRDVRHLLSGLLPMKIGAVDFLPALRGFAEEMSQRFPLLCTVDDDGFAPSLVQNDEVAYVIYQIAREAVHNCLKHASATQVRISLTIDDDFRISVKDNGIGTDLSNIRAKSNGIRIMRYRAESIGGELKIHSEIGIGTTVVLIIPRRCCR